MPCYTSRIHTSPWEKACLFKKEPSWAKKSVKINCPFLYFKIEWFRILYKGHFQCNLENPKIRTLLQKVRQKCANFWILWIRQFTHLEMEFLKKGLLI